MSLSPDALSSRKDMNFSISNFSQKDLLFFKNDILKDFHNIENKLGGKYEKLSMNMESKLDMYENKINALSQKVIDLSNLISTDKNIQEKVIELTNFETRMKEEVSLLKIKIEDNTQDIQNTIFKYDKLFSENIFYPGIIGNMSKFKTFHDFIDYVLNQISVLLQYKEKNSSDLKQYRMKFESLVKTVKMQNENALKAANDFTKKTISVSENTLKDYISILEESIKNLRMENSKHVLNLINNFENIKKEWEIITEIKNEIYKKTNEEINKIKNQNIMVIHMFNNYENDFNLIKNRFSQLAEFIRNVRFRKNAGNLEKEEIKEVSNKLNFNKKQKLTEKDKEKGKKVESFLKKYIEGKVGIDDMKTSRVMSGTERKENNNDNIDNNEYDNNKIKYERNFNNLELKKTISDSTSNINMNTLKRKYSDNNNYNNNSFYNNYEEQNDDEIIKNYIERKHKKINIIETKKTFSLDKNHKLLFSKLYNEDKIFNLEENKNNNTSIQSEESCLNINNNNKILFNNNNNNINNNNIITNINSSNNNININISSGTLNNNSINKNINIQKENINVINEEETNQSNLFNKNFNSNLTNVSNNNNINKNIKNDNTPSNNLREKILFNQIKKETFINSYNSKKYLDSINPKNNNNLFLNDNNYSSTNKQYSHSKSYSLLPLGNTSIKNNNSNNDNKNKNFPELYGKIFTKPFNEELKKILVQNKKSSEFNNNNNVDINNNNNSFFYKNSIKKLENIPLNKIEPNMFKTIDGEKNFLTNDNSSIRFIGNSIQIIHENNNNSSNFFLKKKKQEEIKKKKYNINHNKNKSMNDIKKIENLYNKIKFEAKSFSSEDELITDNINNYNNNEIKFKKYKKFHKINQNNFVQNLINIKNDKLEKTFKELNLVYSKKNSNNNINNLNNNNNNNSIINNKNYNNNVNNNSNYNNNNNSALNSNNYYYNMMLEDDNNSGKILKLNKVMYNKVKLLNQERKNIFLNNFYGKNDSFDDENNKK